MMDCVLTWVDGDDPAFRSRMTPYLTGAREDSRNDMAGRARLSSCREIAVAVASILRFAPYIKRIFIVTDGQDPGLGPFLEKNFPGNKVPVIIVDHKTIFEGFEGYLPVFNSMSIETMLWRIPDLSEDFLYLNDDYFLLAPTTEADVLSPEGRSLFYGSPMLVAWADFLRKFHRKKDGKRRISYRDTLANGARILNEKKFFMLAHTPEAMKKSVFARFFRDNPDVMLSNIAHRFRADGQFNVQSLYYCMGVRDGFAECRSPKDVSVMFRPLQRKWRYMPRKLAKAARIKDLKFGCMNSLQDAREEDARLFWEWVSDKIGVDFSLIKKV